MGLLDDTTQKAYYDSNNYGSYQFTSLEDIINQFMVAYVGEEKIISKARRIDVAFHAQRALRELSFDTFKSIKSQEIVLPPHLTMRLPHDYVNYTKLSWSDGAGIQHIIYPTTKTSNPFKVKQDDDGEYDFVATAGEIQDLYNKNFETALSATTDWVKTPAADNTNLLGGTDDVVASVSEVLTFTSSPFNYQGDISGRAYAVWQEIDVENINLLDASAYGTSAASQTNAGQGVLRFGISSTPGDVTTNLLKANPSLNDQTTTGVNDAPNFLPVAPGDGTNGLAYVEWSDGDTVTSSTQKSVSNIDVSMYDTVYVLITSYTPMTETVVSASIAPTALTSTNLLDTVVVNYEGASPVLIRDGDSTTWTNYKATGSASQNASTTSDTQDTDLYDYNIGQRYGIEPQHAQTNGSFFIDDLQGLIHFSSNISGKTVILDYISDSLGTDGEMQVHKFAEDAMYKWIAHAILSTKSNIPEYVVRRYQKDKFAATRQAKLRLSNIKLEELTQILRGKSKHIKH
jgi:hypothetical protein